jgi:hypothetical protein
MPEEETVTISKLEYLRLKLIDMKMNILEGAGVDNWEEWGCFNDDEDYRACEDEYFALRDQLRQKLKYDSTQEL